LQAVSLFLLRCQNLSSLSFEFITSHASFGTLRRKRSQCGGLIVRRETGGTNDQASDQVHRPSNVSDGTSHSAGRHPNLCNGWWWRWWRRWRRWWWRWRRWR
jgi:hypothetical protein